MLFIFFSVFRSASSITLNRDCGHSAFWVNLNEKICMEMVLIAEHFHAYPLEWHSDTAHSVCSKGLLLLRIFVSGKNKIFVSGQFSKPNVAYIKLNWTELIIIVALSLCIRFISFRNEFAYSFGISSVCCWFFCVLIIFISHIIFGSYCFSVSMQNAARCSSHLSLSVCVWQIKIATCQQWVFCFAADKNTNKKHITR